MAASKTIKEPDSWTFRSRHDLPYSQQKELEEMNIRYEEPIYTKLDERAAKGIKRVISVDRVRQQDIEKVRLMDDETVEIVYYGDDKTELDATIIHRIEKLIQEFFGELWLVERKIDNRRSRNWGNEAERNRNIQRLVVRRMEGRRFRYEDEEDHEYKLMLHGTPAGVSGDAKHWADVDHIGKRPDPLSRQTDLFVYGTSTGTKHLVPSGDAHFYDGVRAAHITESVDTECGITLDPADLAIPETLTHLAEYAAESPFSEAFDPETLLGDDLCRSCWRSFGVTQTDETGTVEVSAPDYDWEKLLEVEVDR